jgi:iron complex outermembrane receptor protein
VTPLNCSIENSVTGAQARDCISGSNTYDKPLYFATINYKLFPDWSVYFQTATGFLIPDLTTLYSDNLSLNNLQPSETTNYQGGTVYSHGRITADADLYKINVSNLYLPCPGANTQGTYCNYGTAHYSGVEGEFAYAFPYGLTAFGNFSINTAKDKGTDQTELDAPKWTDAFGLLYVYHRAQASVTWKEVGSQVVYVAPVAEVAPDGAVLAANQERQIGAYNTINASVGYDFGHFKIKVAGYNLADHRAITSIAGSGTASDFYTFQAGRELLLTLEAKWR